MSFPVSVLSAKLCVSWAFALLILSCGSHSLDFSAATQSATDKIVVPEQSGAGNKEESFQVYLDDENYIVFDIDVDKDGRLDKVVSSARNMGDELIIFISREGAFTRALVTTNLSEDGGRIFGDIYSAVSGSDFSGDEVFSIMNFFPKGEDVATHYVSYQGGGWYLSRTIYEVSDWRHEAARRYRCEVEQGISLQDLSVGSGLERVRQVPDEAIRDEACELVVTE